MWADFLVFRLRFNSPSLHDRYMDPSAAIPLNSASPMEGATTPEELYALLITAGNDYRTTKATWSERIPTAMFKFHLCLPVCIVASAAIILYNYRAYALVLSRA